MSKVIGNIIKTENNVYKLDVADDCEIDRDDMATISDHLYGYKVYSYFAVQDEVNGRIRCKFGITDNINRRKRELGMKIVFAIAHPDRQSAREFEKSFFDTINEMGVLVENEYFDASIALYVWIERSGRDFCARYIDRITLVDNYVFASTTQGRMPCRKCGTMSPPYYIKDPHDPISKLYDKHWRIVYKCSRCEHLDEYHCGVRWEEYTKLVKYPVQLKFTVPPTVTSNDR